MKTQPAIRGGLCGAWRALGAVFSRRLFLSLGILVFIGLLPLAGQETIAPPAARTLRLEPRRLQSPPAYFVTFTLRKSAFPKEPGLAPGPVHRGSIRFEDAADDLPFIWEVNARRLHLDLNRNQDFEDDPGGVVTSDDEGRSFKNVKLAVGPKGEQVEVPVDFSLYSRMDGVAAGSVSVPQIWEAKLDLNGTEWQVAVFHPLGRNRIGQLSGGRNLVIRPWDQREEDSTYSGVLSTNVFLQSGLYVVRHRLVKESGTHNFQVTLEPRPGDLGRLELTCKNVTFLSLAQSGHDVTALITKPSATLNLPPGEYHLMALRLGAGDFQAERLGNRAPLEIKAGRTAVLTSGGPLTNSASVTRRGQVLYFGYELLGADGDRYALLNRGSRDRPSLVVYHGIKEVERGQFEFG